MISKLVDNIANAITNIPNLDLICTILILSLCMLSGYNKAIDFKNAQVKSEKSLNKVVKNSPEIVSKIIAGLGVLVEIGAPLAIVYSLTGNQDNNKAMIRNVALIALILFTLVNILTNGNPLNNVNDTLKNLGVIGTLVLMMKHF